MSVTRATGVPGTSGTASDALQQPVGIGIVVCPTTAGDCLPQVAAHTHLAVVSIAILFRSPLPVLIPVFLYDSLPSSLHLFHIILQIVRLDAAGGARRSGMVREGGIVMYLHPAQLGPGHIVVMFALVPMAHMDVCVLRSYGYLQFIIKNIPWLLQTSWRRCVSNQHGRSLIIFQHKR